VLDLARGLSSEMLTQIAALEVDTVSADGGRLNWSGVSSNRAPVSLSMTSSGGRTVDLLVFLASTHSGAPPWNLLEWFIRTIDTEQSARDCSTRLSNCAVDELTTKSCSSFQGPLKAVAPWPNRVTGSSITQNTRWTWMERTIDGPSDSSLILRVATSADILDEARILAEAFGDPQDPTATDNPDESRLVAERDGLVIATLRVNRSPEVWGIYGLAVDAQHRGTGIGRDLLRRVCRQAHDAGVTRMHLEVEVNNDRALGLYTSLGFTQTSTEDYFEIPL